MAGYTIGLDVQDMSAPVSLNVKQGESGRTINIALTNGGRPYPIPKGAYAVFAGKKPDEKILWNSCTIVDNKIHYEITKQTTAVTGWVPVQIRLYSAGGKLLVTPDFVLIVDAPVTGDEELVTVSQNEVTALTELITEASSLQKEVFWAEYGITTYAEIKEAKNEDKVIVCKKEDSSLVLKLHKVDQFEAEFSAFYDGSNKIWTVSRSDEWSESYTDYLSKEETEQAIEDSVTCFVATYGETTIAEVYEAFKAGNAVFCQNGSVMLPMVRYYAGSYMAYFEGVHNGQVITYTVQNEAWTETAEGLEGDSRFVAEYGVTTIQEIYAAMQEGKSVYCKNGAYEFPLLKYTAPSWTAYFGGTADGYNTTYKVQNATWTSTTEALGTVKTVNGKAPDARGNVQIETGGGAFVVNLDLVERDNGEPMLVPDKTFAEIKTAIDEGRDVTAVVTPAGIVLHVLQYDESKVTFAYSFVGKTVLGTRYTTMQAIVQSDGNVVSDIVSENLVTEVSSGVYVGSGDMPDDCNVQIDPSGEALDLNTLIDARIKVALGVIENGTY